MKRTLIIISILFIAYIASSCSVPKTCPTYAKNNIKINGK